MSNRTRYYLEQCIPELDDLVEKGLFTKAEISKIMKRRTDFEHRLNSRGSSTSDYIKYIAYETDVEKLRKKRLKRILQAGRTNSISDWSIENRIAFIYQRGSNKFPGDLKFWAMYLNFLKTRGQRKSYKKIHTVYNQLLKLHPNNVDVWISCAKYEYEDHANFKSCRNIFQNGLRFNPESAKLWFEYVKFELNFVAKLINRRKVLGLIDERAQELDMLNSAQSDKETSTGGESKDEGASAIRIPTTGDQMKDKLNDLPEANINMLGSAETNPALRGDIALTIYDTAMETLGKYCLRKHKGYYTTGSDKSFEKELNKDAVEFLFKETFRYIDLFDQFSDLDRAYLINHILQYWKNDIYGISLEKDLPELFAKTIFMDITLNVRYMNLEDLDTDQLELAVRKYFAYRAKLEPRILSTVSEDFKAYFKKTFIDPIDEGNDPRFKVLNAIYQKL